MIDYDAIDHYIEERKERRLTTRTIGGCNEFGCHRGAVVVDREQRGWCADHRRQLGNDGREIPCAHCSEPMRACDSGEYCNECREDYGYEENKGEAA